MSEFSDQWAACMQAKGMPVPDVDTVNEVLELVHKLHDAWEAAGAGEELLIGALPLVGLSGPVLEVAGAGAGILAHLYIINALVCLASVALSDLVSLNQQGEVPDFVVAELRENGTDLDNAVA